MPNWLVIPVILLFSFLLGLLIVRLFVPLNNRPDINLAFGALSIGVGVTGWLALILAEMNLFSLLNLAAAWLAAVVLLLLLSLRQRHRQNEMENSKREWNISVLKRGGQSAWLELLMICTWVVIVIWLFFRPHEYIMGGADAGVYISLGAEIANHGGFQILDGGLAELDPALYQAVLRPLPTNPVASSYIFPGFYVVDAAQGAVVPQFYPLHPVWLATAFAVGSSIIESVRAELLMTGLWMSLAVFAVYLTMRDIGGRLTAVLTLIALSLTALQVWFARYPSTEPLTQFLLWAGLWGTVMWLGGRKPVSFWALLSGIMLGLLFLVRIDVLIMLPIIGLLLIALWAGGWRSSDWWFAVSFIVLVIQSFLHAAVLSAPYFYEHIGFGLRIFWRSWLIPLAALLIGLIFIVLVYYFRGRFFQLSRFQKPLKIFIIGLVLIVAIYGWFIRPYFGEQVVVPDAYSNSILILTNHENWIRLGWYLSPIGIWLGVLGMCLLIWHVKWKTILIVAVGLLFSALYLWDVRANPHHVYVMRRYVPIVLPFFIVSAAYLLGWFFELIQEWRSQRPLIRYVFLATGIVIGAIWILGLVWMARGFVSQIDHEGAFAQLAAIENDLPPNSVLIFYDESAVGLGDFWGTPLKYIFGHEVYKLRRLEENIDGPLVELIEIWQNNNRSVVWVGDPTWLDNNGFRYQEQLKEISSRRLESSYEHKPQAIIPVTWSLPLSLIEYGEQKDE
ncbi:MAG: hypothetical protein R3293_19865 [Candidatus Promineifilaceae bacterium]|nr:hypothetical protein [Candidatus Promineifilaceae bacterium]